MADDRRLVIRVLSECGIDPTEHAPGWRFRRCLWRTSYEAVLRWEPVIVAGQRDSGWWYVAQSVPLPTRIGAWLYAHGA